MCCDNGTHQELNPGHLAGVPSVLCYNNQTTKQPPVSQSKTTTSLHNPQTVRIGGCLVVQLLLLCGALVAQARCP